MNVELDRLMNASCNFSHIKQNKLDKNIHSYNSYLYDIAIIGDF